LAAVLPALWLLLPHREGENRITEQRRTGPGRHERQVEVVVIRVILKWQDRYQQEHIAEGGEEPAPTPE